MENNQIKSLALSVAHQTEISDSVSTWISENLSKAEKKRFVKYLYEALKEQKVIVKYAGKLSESVENKVKNMFPGKQIVYVKSDSEVVAGVKFEFGDYILDCSVSDMVGKIMKSIRENL